ncbi:hypothetical protein HHS34_003985 [Acidithiobacillus montserratensis]|uniref:Uncharacterized protein n=1 Tax=Acidithiobacillus montserratensis TaxID=2729135 RepID=A0ACD5HHN3_9PROT|nr:hypothetical protein [Acidithiobacillus montserratensis]MBU2746745.1 hypothetical protein [Acidithiobacillus montserratensis]
MAIAFAALIPTRHRPDLLKSCLERVYSNSVVPTLTIVGDDSTDVECIKKNKKIVSSFYNCFYLPGKCAGPSQNRRDLAEYLLFQILQKNFDISHAAYIDDDIIISKSWFEYAAMYLEGCGSEPHLMKRIIYGPVVSGFGDANNIHQLYRLTFLGYFDASRDDSTSCVNIQAAVFPVCLFSKINFDENIYFGYEDADFCNRAISLGYELSCVSSMLAINKLPGQSSLAEDDEKHRSLDLQIEAARLYVTFKKYFCIERRSLKSVFFLIIFSFHLMAHMVKIRKSPVRILLVFQKSKIWRVLKCSSSFTEINIEK